MKSWIKLGFLLLCGVLVCGAMFAAAARFHDPEPAAWRAVSVAAKGDSVAGRRLLVRGDGLHADLKGLLVPQAELGRTARPIGRLSFPVHQLAANGRLAVAATSDSRLVVLDVAKGHEVSVLGGVQLSSQGASRATSGLALFGSKVLAAKSHNGLFLVDATNPEVPRQIDFLTLPEKYLDMKAAGEVAYLAVYPRGLYMLTVAGDRLRAAEIPNSPRVNKLAVSNDRLVTAGPGGVLTLFEQGRLATPKEVGTGRFTGEVRDLVMSGEALYVCNENGLLMEFSLQSWPQLNLTAQIDLKGRPLYLELMEATRQLFCSLVGSGVAVVDVSRPGAPRLENTLPVFGTVARTRAVDDRLLLSSSDGLRVLNAREMTIPDKLEDLEYPLQPGTGKARFLNCNSNTLVFSNSDMQRLPCEVERVSAQADSSAASHPLLALSDEKGVRLCLLEEKGSSVKMLARIPIDDAAAATETNVASNPVKRALWRGDRLFVLSSSKVTVFEADGSGKVTLREIIPLLGNAVDMVLLPGGCLVVATSKEGLLAYDVTRPGATRPVGSYPFPRFQQAVGMVKHLLADGSRLFVSRGRLGVEIYDFSQPENARLLQRIDTPGYADKLALQDDLLLVADRQMGLFIIDVQGDEAVAVGSYALPFYPTDLVSDGSTLFLLSSANGVLRLPAPRRLEGVGATNDDQMELAIPSGSSPRKYQLALYDDRYAANLPVTLQ